MSREHEVRSEDAEESPAAGPAVGRRSLIANRYPALAQALADRDAAGGEPTIHDAATIAVERKGGGAAVDANVAGRVGAHLGADFSGVRVHSDPLTQQATAAMGARAFAYGGDVFLGAGESGSDLGLMAHELTHVAQQGAAGQRAVQRQVQVGNADSPAEREADQVAAQVTGGQGRPASLLVDDGPVQPGQMLKSQFLEQLRAEVTAAANAELGPIYSAIGCPYIEQYFSRYAGQPASSGEALLRRFAPATRSASTAADMIPAVVARVREGTRQWRDTGQAPPDLAGLGGASAATGAAAVAGAGAGAAGAGAPGAGAAGPGGDAGAPGANASDAQGLAEMAAGPIMQRKAVPGTEGAALDADQPARVAAELGPGQALDGTTASRMGGAFGQDFSHVRIHTDAVAARVASEVGALAFTVGPHVAFSAGAYAPGSLEGDALLAHELAHVSQQGDALRRKLNEGQDSGTHSSGDSALEADADQAAAAVVQRLHGNSSVAAPKTAMSSGLSLRRCDSGSKKKAGPSVTPEIQATSGDMGKRVVDDMNKANAGPNTLDSGIHYWYRYRELCQASDPGRWNDDLKAGMADANYWERIGWKQWRLKSGVSASEGLKSWLKGPTIAECHVAILAFETDAMRAAIGDAKFDELFGSPDKDLGTNRLVLGGPKSSIYNYMKDTDAKTAGDAGTIGNRPVQEGEWYYFYNHSMMLAKHPASSWQGENALYLGKDGSGKQIWAGLGTSDGSGGSHVTEEQMYDQMANAYNKPRNADDIAKLDEIKKDNGGTLPAIYDESKLPTNMDQAKILADPGSDKIDGKFRKGGFRLGAGKTLDAAKIAKLRP